MTFKIRVSCCKNHVDRVTKAELLTAGERTMETRGPTVPGWKVLDCFWKFSAVHRRGEAEALMGVCHSWLNDDFLNVLQRIPGFFSKPLMYERV